MELNEQEKNYIHILLKGYSALVLKSDSYDKDNSLADTQSRIDARDTLINSIYTIVKDLPDSSKVKNFFILNKKKLRGNKICKEVLADFKNSLPVNFYLELIIAEIFDHILELEKSLPYYTTTDLTEHFFQKPEDIFKMILFQLHHFLQKRDPQRIWPILMEIIFINPEFKKYFDDASLKKSVDYPQSLSLNKINDRSSKEFYLKKRLIDQVTQWEVQSKKFKHSPLISGSEN